MKKLRVCNRGDNFTLQQTMHKSIQFIQCLTIINENAEARRSLRSFKVVAWLGLQTRVISKAIENELADAKETFTILFTLLDFVSFVSYLKPSQHKFHNSIFIFHYFSSKQAFIFILYIFVFFFSIKLLLLLFWLFDICLIK